MAVELNPYLLFRGTTERAIAFYQEVFGGQVTITRRGDVDPTATAEEKNQVVNALLTDGDIPCGPATAGTRVTTRRPTSRLCRA